MTHSRRLFTSESVTEGHPDKVCDQISDSILDAILTDDPTARVAVETLVTTGLVHVAGEVETEAYVEIPRLVRDVVTGIGYTSSAVGFDGASCGVSISIGQQSPDIAQGVNTAWEVRSDADSIHDKFDNQGAGDQGIMFGYASNETDALMPLPIHASHRLAERLAHVRQHNIVDGLRPDGKTQVTVAYDGHTPVAIDTVVVSTQHAPDLSQDDVHDRVRSHVIEPVLATLDVDTSDVRLIINPTGKFVVGGPMGDAGLTGRKIIVDTYGGWPAMEVARSLEKTHQRLTVPQRTPPGGWQKTWSPQV